MAREVTVNNCVLKGHALYSDLVLMPKYTSFVNLNPEAELKGHAQTETCEIPFIHVNDTQGYVICRQNTAKRSNYHFNLFVKNFMEEPLFRFDASGPSHKAKISSLPYKKRSTKTPHFNKYNEDGYIVAYRTDFIDEYEAEILGDINIGLSHFCEECTLVGDFRKKIKILKQLDLFSLFPEIDPHSTNVIEFDE